MRNMSFPLLRQRLFGSKLPLQQNYSRYKNLVSPPPSSSTLRYNLGVFRCCRPHAARHFVSSKSHRQNEVSFQEGDKMPQKTLSVCVVGGGPSGFYTSKYLLSQFSKSSHSANYRLHISMIEKLPTPYGLVRYGVAPDHPEVKFVTNDFESIASQQEKFSFFGNVQLGKDVSIDELKRQFDIIVLSYGSSNERKLGIKGEDDIIGVESAREFVSWYNGLPVSRNDPVSSAWMENATKKYAKLISKSKKVVIIGQGNVALDVARILAKPLPELQPYDLPDYALDLLHTHNHIQHIYVVGRRGPVQAACTTKELREITKIDGASLYVDPNELLLDSLSQQELDKVGRVKKRLLDVMKKASTLSKQDRIVQLTFFKNPIEFVSDCNGNLTSIRFEVTKLEGTADHLRAVGTGEILEIECDLAFRSIGYKAIAVDDIPFDHHVGIVPNVAGKVMNESRNQRIQGLYVSGWLKRGPTGVILSNIVDSEETVSSIMQDLNDDLIKPSGKLGKDGLSQLLNDRNISYITFDQFKLIDQHEVKSGELKGKIRDKLIYIEDMLSIANRQSN